MSEDTCKIVILGSYGVGKTNLIASFMNNIFDPYLMYTISPEYVCKTVFIEDYNQSIKCEICDTNGSLKYLPINRTFYKDADACILVYDITRGQSFFELKDYFLKDIKENSKSDVSK